MLWTGWQNEAPVLIELAKEFSIKTGVPVKVISIPFADLKNKFQLAAPAYVGPDLITGPNDWVGVFVTANLISPLPVISHMSEILPVGRKGVEFKGSIAGFPMFMEGIALIYNRDLAGNLPGDMAEIIQISHKFKTTGKYGLVFDVTNFYFTWPFWGGWGADIFYKNTENSLTPVPALAENPSINAASYLKGLILKEQLFPSSMTGDVANGLFLERKAAMLINGPWFIEDIRKSNISFGISKLPKLPNDKYPTPFVGIQGIYLNNRTKKLKESAAFLEFLGGPNSIVRLSKASGRIPVDRRALKLLESDAVVKGFSQVLKDGVPLPNVPAMTQVWPYMSECMKLIMREESNVEEVMKATVKQISNAINRLTK